MQRFKYMFLLWGCIAALAILATQSTGVEAATQKQSPPKLLPTSASITSTLFGITTLSSDSAWAVGTSMNIPQFTGQPLIEHWDGSHWQIVPGPRAPQNKFNSLVGVTALTNDDAWAVGFSMDTTKNTGQPLIEHWDGSHWQIVSNPTVFTTGSLSAITATGPNDIWAIGSTYSPSGTTSKPLILHWNGSDWQIVHGASTTGNSSLVSVAAVNANDVWAVGSSSSAKASKTLIEHWNGTSWRLVPGTTSGMSFNSLSAVTALPNHDIWAVGNSFSQPSQVHPFIERWDGKNWNPVATTGLQGSFAPTAISAVSSNDLWIAGAGTLAHWNGKNWQNIAATSQKSLNLFNAIAILAHDDIWAAGFSLEAKSAITLIEHWTGANWQVVASPSLVSKHIGL
jgi:hypothetical protein